MRSAFGDVAESGRRAPSGYGEISAGCGSCRRRRLPRPQRLISDELWALVEPLIPRAARPFTADVRPATDGGERPGTEPLEKERVDPADGSQVVPVRAAAVEAARAGCTWLHVDFGPHLRPFHCDVCGFRFTDAALLHLVELEQGR